MIGMNYKKEIWFELNRCVDLLEFNEGLNGFRLLPNSTVSDDETPLKSR